MSDPRDIPSDGGRYAWVLSYDGTVEDLNATLSSPETYKDAFGLLEAPEEGAIEWFDLAAMKEYGFARYLSEASEFDIAKDTQKLDALSSTVVLIYSTGLHEKDKQLSPKPPFEVIGRYETPLTTRPFEPLTSKSAEGLLMQGKPPKSPARISGMVATFVLVFLALFVTLFVWISG
ncbi:hypothetical protein [Celeribacter sp. ULVN23_4]